MSDKEATARIKINKLLEAAGWLFFADGSRPANICLEPSVSIKTSDLDALGENFEKTSRGFIDFLLLDARGFPFIVLEAKAEDKMFASEMVGRVADRAVQILLYAGLRDRAPVSRRSAIPYIRGYDADSAIGDCAAYAARRLNQPYTQSSFRA